jgi:hypothetical protein
MNEGPPYFLHHLDVLRELAAVRGLERRAPARRIAPQQSPGARPDGATFLFGAGHRDSVQACHSPAGRPPRPRLSQLLPLWDSYHHRHTNQVGGHPPRVTSLRSRTRTNRNGELKPCKDAKQERAMCSNHSYSEELETKNKE